jgi:hypothetical protein
MMVPGAGAAGTLSEARNHCAKASADTAATVNKALFRDGSICKILDKFPSLNVAAPFDRRTRYIACAQLAAYCGRTVMLGTTIRQMR